MGSAPKVGLLVVVFIGLLLTAYGLLEKSLFAKQTDTYYIEFENAGGLQSGARVLLAGVQIGSVSAVELMTPGKARAVVSIERGYSIPQGSTAVLPTSFISIGDRQVEIITPTDVEKVPALAPGSSIVGRLASPLDAIVPNSEETVAELNKTLVAFREFVSDPELKESFTRMVTTSERTIQNFGDLAHSMNGMIRENSDSFEGILASTRNSLENLEAVSVEVKKLVESGELQDKTVALLDNMNEAVIAGKELVAELNALASDPEMKASLKSTLANVETMSDSGTRIAASAETMAANGAVVSEEVVTLSRKANALADDVKELLESFKGAVDRFKGVTAPGAGGVEVQADLLRETDPSRFRADLGMSIPIGEERLHLGLYDAFESNKLNLQISRDFSNYLALRYGVYASKPGIGVDYRLAPSLGLRADLFDLNDPQLDLRLGYRFDEKTTAYLGFERIFRSPMAVVGVGIKK